MIEQKNFRPLFSEITPLFFSNRDTPNIIRVRIRMQNEIDEKSLRHAVGVTMGRYPYFCVELQKRGGEWGFTDNPRPVAISHSLTGVKLNSEASNYHLLAFSWHEDWITMDVSHALTDGTGAREIARTLLYYYCSDRYRIPHDPAGIRLAGDVISSEEWDDPAPRVTLEPPEDDNGGMQKPVLNIVGMSGLENDTRKTVYSISIDEGEFMHFNIEHDGSPGTIVSLLLSRAIASIHPESQSRIVISLCVNLRNALGCPLAHQSLVSDVCLEYKEKMRKYPLTMQAMMYRGMVFLQTQVEKTMTVMGYINRNTREMLSMSTDRARAAAAKKLSEGIKQLRTATVSYVGKGNFADAERYIREYHMLANAVNENILIEISAVNGRFMLVSLLVIGVFTVFSV